MVYKKQAEESIKKRHDGLRLILSEAVEDRRSGYWMLGQCQDKSVVKHLIKALRDEPDIWTRGSVANALGMLNSKRGITALIDHLLHDPEVSGRERAASSLRFIQDARVHDALVQSMENTDEDPIVREMVAEALSYPETARAISALIAALDDPHPNVRFWASSSLRRSADPRALPKLLDLAANDTTMCYEPDISPPIAWGSVSTSAAEAAIRIKIDCNMELTEEELDL